MRFICMSNRSTEIDNIRKLLELAEKREALLNQVTELEEEMDRLKRQSSRIRKARKRNQPRKAKPGALTDAIIQLLSGAGPSGMLISDIAGSLKKPVANIRVWFSTTGKKNPRIKKLAVGRFALATTKRHRA
jgi:hypothetical protein